LPSVSTNPESPNELDLQEQDTILCFSHLRWNFVYQRPQHLLTRAAAHARVFFIEEPIFSDIASEEMRFETKDSGVEVVTFFLPRDLGDEKLLSAQRLLVDALIREREIRAFTAWYYTPMALLFTNHLQAQVTVYDCMDQLSAFKGAPPSMVEWEKALFAKADVVFMGGRSLYESKRSENTNSYAYPSSVDFAHFAKSRTPLVEPIDQLEIPHPRIGFFGVLDERLDCALLQQAAALRPDYHFVLIGPVVKINPNDLPQSINIHYLGPKQYNELPDYLAHWDVAMLPFAINDSTRFISPTKTPEYLSAGKQVVSTPIPDVIEPYQRLGFVRIAQDANSFCAAIAAALDADAAGNASWLSNVDEYLSQTSWCKTFDGMWNEVIRLKKRSNAVL
jgi:glycosyltransferase involved in cell wall biosynthesis